jgi:hypothetical protein
MYATSLCLTHTYSLGCKKCCVLNHIIQPALPLRHCYYILWHGYIVYPSGIQQGLVQIYMKKFTMWHPALWSCVATTVLETSCRLCSSMKCTWSIKGEVIPVHTIKVHRGSKCTVPLIPNLDTGWNWVVNFMSWSLQLWEITPAPTEQEAAWAPKPVWMFWGSIKSLDTAKIRIPERPVHSSCTILLTGVCSSNTVVPPIR